MARHPKTVKVNVKMRFVLVCRGSMSTVPVLISAQIITMTTGTRRNVKQTAATGGRSRELMVSALTANLTPRQPMIDALALRTSVMITRSRPPRVAAKHVQMVSSAKSQKFKSASDITNVRNVKLKLGKRKRANLVLLMNMLHLTRKRVKRQNAPGDKRFY